MKILSGDRSNLMEVKEVGLAGGKICVSGMVMGAMPMKGFVHPAELRALMRRLGFRKVLAIGWAIMTASRA
jgi:hypothetical protein